MAVKWSIPPLSCEKKEVITQFFLNLHDYMVMRIVGYIGALALLAVASCSDDVDLLQQQQKTVVSYLTTSHTPRLLSAEDAAQSLDNEPPYYEVFGDGSYRYIADVYNAERLQRTEVTKGATVDVTFSLYTFSGQTPTLSACVYSNDAAVIKQLVSAGLNPLLWVECDDAGEPLRDEEGSYIPLQTSLTVGDGSLLVGLDEALIGCREEDNVEIYMTYDEAYGSKVIVGLVPKESAVALYCKINKVTK
jgi:hypothetical protein